MSPAGLAPPATPVRRPLPLLDFVAPILVGAALVGGGGGPLTPPAVAAAIQLLGLAALLLGVLHRAQRRVDPGAQHAMLFAAMMLLIPLVQLIPLPPSIWRSLPGRDLATATRDLLGLGGRWFPFTLDPEATRGVFFALLPPAGAFFATLVAGERLRRRLIVVILAVAAADLVVGALQFAGGGSSLLAFYVADSVGLGFFANRNHNADFLLIAPLLFVAWLRLVGRSDGLLRTLAAAALALAALGVLVTLSRTGLLLLPIPALGVTVLLLSRRTLERSSIRAAALISLALAAVLALMALIALNNGVFLRVLDRFDAVHDQRLDFWPDVIYAIRQAWPYGTGSGTFEAVFRTVERLDIVGATIVNHAHDDYLELMLELGAGGALVILAGLVLFLRVTFDTFAGRRGAPLNPVAAAAIFSWLILLLHSLVDYPLRTAALGTLAGVLAGLVYQPARLLDAARRTAGPVISPSPNA